MRVPVPAYHELERLFLDSLNKKLKCVFLQW